MKIENTIYLSEVQEQYDEIMFLLESFRIKRDEFRGTQQEFNIALDLILKGAKQEMQRTIREEIKL
jgi:hypothetical protein|tara:strand:- start:2931 stop:3128 length:198 start_codon:yes stop_codon:yes gene_type:complete